MFYRFSVNIHNHIIVQFLKCCCSLIILNVSFDNFTHIEYTFENDEALVIIIYLIFFLLYISNTGDIFVNMHIIMALP